MAEISDYARNQLIDFLFRGQPMTPPSTLYIGLNTVAANHALGSGTEVSGGAYARVGITSGLANWAGTQASGSTTVSSGSGATAVTSNNITISFPAPTAAWGTAVGYTIWDAPSGGNLWYFGPLQTPKTINGGDAQPSFAVGALSCSFDA